MKQWRSTAYGRIEALLTEGANLVLDGGVGSEVANAGASDPASRQAADTWAIYDDTDCVIDIHRRYASAGCDVISTHTWGILGSIASDRGRRPGRTGLPAWTVATRDAVSLARRAVAETGRSGDCAVAFCLNDADPTLAGAEVLLKLLWDVDPPDLVLVETLATSPDSALLDAIADIVASGLPVWASFQLVTGGAPETPTVFTKTLADLERAGVHAVLTNCIPVHEVTTTVAAMAAATDLPVGCYPRLDEPVDPAVYGELSLQWQAAGARIIGGCCGVGPAHIRAVRDGISLGIPARS